ncbi:unnamed protein product [Zymoseptoria tritici ST99CH_3D1]|nr:unnamed protein product [Zymoseptoria tritici ST99CH_3D1]
MDLLETYPAVEALVDEESGDADSESQSDTMAKSDDEDSDQDSDDEDGDQDSDDEDGDQDGDDESDVAITDVEHRQNLVESVAEFMRETMTKYFMQTEEFGWMNRDSIQAMFDRAAAEITEGVAQAQEAIEASRRRFDFFKLSPELRNVIYEDVLGIHEDDLTRNNEVSVLPPCNNGTMEFAPSCSLMHVNRKLRSEVLPLFLSTRVFFLPLERSMRRGYLGRHQQTAEVDHEIRRRLKETFGTVLLNWLQTIGDEQAQKIRPFTMHGLPQYFLFGGVSKREVLETMGLDQCAVKEETFVISAESWYCGRVRGPDPKLQFKSS